MMMVVQVLTTKEQVSSDSKKGVLQSILDYQSLGDIVVHVVAVITTRQNAGLLLPFQWMIQKPSVFAVR